jgi:serpin B
MSMLYLGTTNNSDTSDEIGKALGSIQNQKLLKLGYYNVVNTYCNEKNFLYGNAFWVQEGFRVKPAFIKTVEDNMDSDVETIDFGGSDSVPKVNAWVRQKTGGKIPNLVDSFDPQTALFIANALYFKEQWKVPFSRAHAQRFQTPLGQKEKVPMIDITSNLITYEEIRISRQTVEVVTIPYDNELFEMVIYLPGKGNGMAQLEALMKLSQDSDQSPNHALYFNLFDGKHLTQPDEFYDEVYLKMPTFKIKTDLDAAEPLRKMGVKKVKDIHS